MYGMLEYRVCVLHLQLTMNINRASLDAFSRRFCNGITRPGIFENCRSHSWSLDLGSL